MAKHKGPQVTQAAGTQVPLAQALQSIPVGDNWSLLDDLSQELKMPVLALYIGEGYMLQPALLRPFYEVLESIGRTESLGLFLRSTGGITEVPWKIVSLLREYSKNLTILVPEVAHSGATHITLAADTLIMTELSTLSSVDPTRRHPLLPKDKDGDPIPASVQDLKHCVTFIKEQLGKDHTGSDVATIIKELFGHVHPLALGAIEQSAELSKIVTRKVLATRRENLSTEHVEKIVEQLAGKYFSHVFPISREDVRRDLGLTVTDPSAGLKAKMEALLRYYENEAKPVGTGKMDSIDVRLVRAVFIESSQLRKVGYACADLKNNALAILWKTIPKGGSHAKATTSTDPAGKVSTG